MKITRLLFLLFQLSYLHAQITYQVYDNQYESSVDFADVLSSEKELLTTTDEDGKFTVPENQKFVVIHWAGYKEKYVQLDPKQPLLFLDFEEQLSAVEVKANEDIARKLIREVIARQKKNSPDNLENYRFTSYQQLNIDTEPDSIKVDYEWMEKSKDSSEFFFKKVIERSSLFLWEKVLDIKHDRRWGNKEEVIAQKMSGLKKPIYEFLQFRPNSYYLEEDEFNFFLIKYPNPVSKLGLEEFKYAIIDTLHTKGEKIIQLQFSPKQFEKAIKPIVGYIYVEENSKSVTEFYAERTKDPFAYIQMKWKKHSGYYFPDSQFFYIQLIEAESSEKEVKNNKGETATVSTESEPLWLEHRSVFKDFEIPAQMEKKEFRGYEYEISPSIVKNSEEILNKERDSLTSRQEATYFVMDSIFEANNVERYIKYSHLITRGTFPIGNKVELNIPRLFHFNDYEGFRTELNLHTNEYFHPKWRLKGYGAYGFRDKAFKFGGAVSYLANPRKSGNIFVDYRSDVFQMGRYKGEFLYDKTLMKEMLNNFYFRDFYKSNKLKLGYEQDFFQNLTMMAFAEWSQDKAGVPYSYNFNPLDTTYDMRMGHFTMVWMPFNKYMKTPYGKVTMEKRETFFGIHAVKSFADLGSDFDFESLELWFNHKMEYRFGALSIFGRAGHLWGNAPLFYHFEGKGNARGKESSFWKNVTFSGHYLFETMNVSEFFMDRYMSFQLTHWFPKFRLGKNKVLTQLMYRGIWGDESQTQHILIPLEAPTEYFQEMGIEFKQLLFGTMGIGAYYRLGNYAQDEFKDNFYLKINFTMPFMY